MLAAPMQGAGDSLLSQVLSAAVKRGLVEPKQHVVCVLSVRGDLVLNVCQVDEKGSGLKSNLASLGGSPDCSPCCACKRCVSRMRSRESLDWRPLHPSCAELLTALCTDTCAAFKISLLWKTALSHVCTLFNSQTAGPASAMPYNLWSMCAHHVHIMAGWRAGSELNLTSQQGNVSQHEVALSF